MERAEKTRESRVRRLAKRKGYHLSKSRQRDPEGSIAGYLILDPDTNACVAGGRDWFEKLSLEEVEAWLSTK